MVPNKGAPTNKLYGVLWEGPPSTTGRAVTPTNLPCSLINSGGFGGATPEDTTITESVSQDRDGGQPATSVASTGEATPEEADVRNQEFKEEYISIDER